VVLLRVQRLDLSLRLLPHLETICTNNVEGPKKIHIANQKTHHGAQLGAFLVLEPKCFFESCYNKRNRGLYNIARRSFSTKSKPSEILIICDLKLVEMHILGVPFFRNPPNIH
jgi:hypothetical protein